MLLPFDGQISRTRGAFTLIEMSIVLVIVAMLLGGVVLGRDLIEVSNLRSQVSQLEEFDAAVNAFKSKYNCLPGDCPYGVKLGLVPEALPGQYGSRDGNGILTPRSGYPGTGYQMGELLTFWQDLAKTGLIKEPISNVSHHENGCPFSLAQASGCFPICKLGDSCLVQVYYSPAFNQHFYFVAKPSGSLQFSAWPTATITPGEVMVLDTKLDDGVPSTGRVRLIMPGNGSLDSTDSTGSTRCSTSDFAYNLSQTYVNQSLCVPRIRAGF